MARPKFAVHHFVGSLDSRVVPPVGPYNKYELLGVGPVFRLPANTAFPCVLWRYDLFARFFVRRPGPADFEIEVRWLAGRPSLIDTYGPITVHFRAGQLDRDYLFIVRNATFVGLGRYAFRLYELRTGRRRLAATEYLIVEG